MFKAVIRKNFLILNRRFRLMSIYRLCRGKALAYGVFSANPLRPLRLCGE
jgi:hypothetical protein